MTKVDEMFLKEPYAKILNARTVVKTKEAYANDFIRFDKFLAGADPVKVDGLGLQKFIQSMIEQKYAARTIARQMSTLSLLYESLVGDNVIQNDPTKFAFKIFDIEPSKRKPKALTKEQRQHLKACLRWDTTQHIKISLSVSIGLYTGLRRAEIWKLQWKDIDFKNETLYTIGKGNKEATLPIPKPLMDLFNKYNLRDEKYVIGNISYSNTGHWHEVIVKKWCGWGKEVKYSCHVLRHSFVTELAEQTDPPIPPHIIQALARHSSFNTTQNYLKIEDSVLKSAMNGAFK